MRGEPSTEAAKRMEAAPDTSAHGQRCQLAGKHRCGGPVSKSWGDRFLCSVGWLLFADHYHAVAPKVLEHWMRAQGWTP
jgi:hypothetical protein